MNFRRGGGSAITVDQSRYNITEYKPENPHKVEATFALLRPTEKKSPDFIIIVCAIYSPPKSKKNTKLIDFITANYH